MVKEALFTHNDILMLEHLSGSAPDMCPFESDAARRQAISRLRRRITNDAADFFAVHLEEWRAIKSSFEYNLIGEEEQERIQTQIWNQRESLYRFLIDWIPNDSLDEFLNEFLVRMYTDEILKNEGAFNPLIPMRFWGNYLAQFDFEDPLVHRVCERMSKEMAKFDQLTANKRSIVTFDTTENEDGLSKVWIMDPEMFDQFMAYEKSDQQDNFVYVIPGSAFQSGEHDFLIAFNCCVLWNHWILSVAYQIFAEGKKVATNNQLMNRLSRLIFHNFHMSTNDLLLHYDSIIENPDFLQENFQEVILVLLNQYFDNFRTNEPGRPSVARSKRQDSNGFEIRDDLYVKSLLKFLGNQGGRGRRAPLDELGNPSTGAGRGFKGFLRKRVNELVKMGLIESVGKGFAITSKGIDVWRHRPMMGVNSYLVPLSLDKLRERIQHYSNKNPNAAKENLIHAAIKFELPGAKILNHRDIYKFIINKSL